MTKKGFTLNQTLINEAQVVLDTKGALALYEYMETQYKDRYSMLAYIPFTDREIKDYE